MTMSPTTHNRDYSLDILRIAATILIVFHHYQQCTGAFFEGRLNFYNGRFYFGYIVEFFFLLSGFFMVSYIGRIRDGLPFRKFLLKRVIRLLPLVFLSGAAYEIILCLHKFIIGTDWFQIQVNPWGLIIDALGIQDGWVFPNPSVNNPTWYISVLLLCYILFFILTYIAKRLKFSPVYLYIFMVLIGCGIRTYSISLPFLNSSSSRGFYAFFFGILLGMLLQKYPLRKKHVILSACLIALLSYLIFSHWTWVEANINYLMTFCFYPALIVIFSSDTARSMFRHPIIGTLGKITYDVYLWHNPLFPLMFVMLHIFGLSPNLNSMRAMILYTVISFGAGTISYFVLDKPIHRYLQKKTGA